MDTGLFDRLTRLAGNRLSRRASVTTLGAAGLALLARPGAAGAKTNANVDKRCKRQVNPCKARTAADCGEGPGCAESIACCDKLENCRFGNFLTCQFAVNASQTVVGMQP